MYDLLWNILPFLLACIVVWLALRSVIRTKPDRPADRRARWDVGPRADRFPSAADPQSHDEELTDTTDDSDHGTDDTDDDTDDPDDSDDMEEMEEMEDMEVADPSSADLGSGDSRRMFTDVVVLFGTNRSKAKGDGHYGTGRDAMHYGACIVNVPSDRRLGSIPTPSIWTLYRTRADKHFFVREVTEQDQQRFLSALRNRVGRSGNAFVFVHGFNVTFVDAVYRTAQIAADLGFNGTPILFSWPSQGRLSPLGYTTDETQARWALPDLRAFLELVIEQSGADTIHLLAHSMGNRALTDALCQMGTVFKNSPAAFTELILTAPDIDADTFVREIAPSVLPSSRRVTLYASGNDKALAFSKTVHGYRRAGDTGEDITVVDGIDTIDVSAVDTNLIGHFYYGSNRTVLSDMYYLMRGRPVSERFSLKNRRQGEKAFWVFQP